MAYANHNTPVLAGFFSNFGAFGAALSERLERRRTYRRTVNELRELTDRDLADLGIHRSMIRNIALEASYGK